MNSAPLVPSPKDRGDLALAGLSFFVIGLAGPPLMGHVFPVYSLENLVLALSLPGLIVVAAQIMQRRLRQDTRGISGALWLWGVHSAATLIALSAFLLMLYFADVAHRLNSFTAFAYTLIIAAGLMCIYG